jgi:hypothetical protein
MKTLCTLENPAAEVVHMHGSLFHSDLPLLLVHGTGGGIKGKKFHDSMI